MGSRDKSSSAIAKRQQPTLTVPEEHREKAEVIIAHLLGFAAIDKRELTTELMDLYVKTICNHKPEFSLRQIEKGMQTYLETGSKWPWPSDLIEMIEDEI